MFCSKCHTHIIDDSIKFCSRCGNELETDKRKKFSSFKPSINKFNSTFKSTIKHSVISNQKNNIKEINNVKKQEHNITNISQPNNIGMTHDEQATYSRQYSGLNKNPIKTHDEQAAYSRYYSGLTKNPVKTHDEQYNYNVRYSFNKIDNIQTPTSDVDYRNAYINTNIKDIINTKFSIPALLFGPLYLMYRKMTVLGLILQIFIFYILITMESSVGTAIHLIINIIIACKFREIYLNYVNKQVQNIKVKNPDKSTTELINICKYKGGTKEFKTIIILGIILYALFEFISNNSDYTNKNTNIINNNSEKQIDLYKYEIPNDLTEEETSSNYHSYSYSYYNNLESCKFLITYGYSDSSSANFLLQEKKYYPEYNSSNIQIREKNNLRWYYQNLVSTNNKIYMYAYQDYTNNKLFLITTTSNELDEHNKCEQITNQIINSFKKEY